MQIISRWWNRAGQARWSVIATLVFACAATSLYHGFVGKSFTQSVPAFLPDGYKAKPSETVHPIGHFAGSDQRLNVWLAWRNARTLLTRPHHYFDGEHCYPASKSLALIDPLVTTGLLAIPGYLATRDPVATFNLLWLTINLLAAFAMYLLVREWTGIPAAGIAAALFYAFHPVKLWNVIHPFIDDTGWTVLAMFFATRWLQHGRWRDAAGLACSCALQIAQGVYPLIAAAVIAVPMGIWLLIQYGVRRLRPVQCLLVLAVLGATAWTVFHPFLAWQAEGVITSRSYQVFAAWSNFLPGQFRFPGWMMLGLVVLGLLLGRKRAVGALRGDPRWALLIAGALVFAMATGGDAGETLLRGRPGDLDLPNLYRIVAAVVPGLENVRVPKLIASGVHLVLSVLAGVGAAALIRAVPGRAAAAVAVALIVVVYLDMLRPRTLGLEPRTEFVEYRVRPSEDSLEFFRILSERGNSGPIFEVPTTFHPMTASAAIISMAYHQRPTSWCMGSFHPPVSVRVREIGFEMPALEPLRELKEMGFTTVIVHHGPYLATLRRSYQKFTETHPGSLRKIHGNATMTAYSIEP